MIDDQELDASLPTVHELATQEDNNSPAVPAHMAQAAEAADRGRSAS